MRKKASTHYAAWNITGDWLYMKKYVNSDQIMSTYRRVLALVGDILCKIVKPNLVGEETVLYL